MTGVSDMRSLIASELADVHHCLPGVIVAWDGVTATVRPVIDMQLTNGAALAAPSVVRVPVKWMCASMAGGQAIISVPLHPGDDVVLTFCDRAIEEWLQGIDGVPSDPRQFDISDAFCTPVLRPSRGIAADTENLSVRFGAGGLTIDPSGAVRIFGTSITLDAPLTTIEHDMSMPAGNASVSGDVTSGGLSFRNHRHPETGSITDGPTA